MSAAPAAGAEPRLTAATIAQLLGGEENGTAGFKARCPCCHALLLSVDDKSGHVVVRCHGTCEQEAVTRAINDLARRARENPTADVSSLGWPDALAPEAFHGLLGEWVRALEPHTESDPAALLVQALAAVGNLIGRGPHFRAEADRHFTILNVALVGRTAKARKGTSEGHVRRLCDKIDPDWALRRIKSGLSSGEGLIYEVRDGATQGKGKHSDPGELDKRLLVIEPEMASVFQAAERNGSTLSSIIRRAWDSPLLLSPMTKTARVEATNPHISLICHITREELTRVMSDTAAANGFGNRILWLATRRSKCLPEGGLEVDTTPITDLLREAVKAARAIGEMKRDAAARGIWRSVYPELSEGKPGLLGAVTARAESQVMRIALIFAVLDGSHEIREDHLLAGLAIWTYCFNSARWIFGDALGDPLADEILAFLRTRPEGASRTDITNYFGRNRRGEDIGRALAVLAEQGRASSRQEQTGGRPVETWRVRA